MSIPPPSYNDTAQRLPSSFFPELTGQRIILCSASPRRASLLNQIGLEAEIIPSDFPETLNKEDYGTTPWEYATATATEKILAVYKRVSDDKRDPRLLISADTIILAGHSILEKPSDPAHHLDMLKQLRKGPHKVFTAVACLAPYDDMPVAPGYVLRTFLSESTVTFDSSLTDDVLAEYVKNGEGSDKAGGYAIQGQGAMFVERIEGSYDGVVGLPLNATCKLIREVLDYDVYAIQGESGDEIDD